MLRQGFNAGARRYEAFLRWLFDQSAPIAFFLLMLFGAGMLVLSVVVEVAAVEFELPSGARKQVGYLWALNWSFVLFIGFPLMFFFMLESADSLRRTLSRLVDYRMIVDRDWRPVALARLDADRDAVWRRAATFGFALLILVMAVVLVEWLLVSGYPLIANRLPIAPGEADFFDELDWSVAAVLPGPRGGELWFRLANAAFSFLNYVVIGLYVAIAFTYFAMLVIYADLFRRLSQGKVDGDCRIIPDVNEEDRRRGFALFNRVFQRVLLTALVAYLICYCMNIQNAFLRSDATDILAFVAPDLGQGFAALLDGRIREGLGAMADALFTAPHIFNLTSSYGIMLTYGSLALVALSIAWTLWQAADRGRDDLRAHIAKGGAIDQLTSLDRAEARRRLSGGWDAREKTGMDSWPFGWPSLSQLFVFLCFGLICVVFYRIGLVYTGVAIAWVMSSALGKMNRA